LKILRYYNGLEEAFAEQNPFSVIPAYRRYTLALLNLQCDEENTPANGFGFRLGDAAGLSALFFAWLIFFIPVLFQDQSVFFRDILHFAYPMKHFIRESLLNGDWPFWWPSIHAGVPFLSLLHPGALYPLNFILLIGDFNGAFNLFLALHFLILAAGCYCLGRAMGFSFYAGIACGLTALWGGFFFSLSQLHNHFQSSVWLPWILFFFSQFLQKGGRARFFFTVLAFVFQVLAGSPEYCLLTTALLFAYTAFIHRPKPDTAIWKPYAFLAMGTAFTLALSAIQLVPTQMAIPHTVRDAGLPFNSATMWSFPFKGLGSFLFPADFNGFMSNPNFRTDYFILSPYMGWFPVAFLIVGFLTKRSRIFYFWTGVFFTGVFFALGRFNPFYEWMFDWIPFIGWFRYPEKFLVLTAFAGVFLSGLGVDAIHQWTRSHIRETTGLLGGLLVVALAHWMLDDWSAMIWQTVAGLSIALVLFILHSKSLLSSCALKAGLLIVIALDLLLKNSPLLPLMHKNFFEQPPEIFAQLAERNPLQRFYSGPLLESEKIPTKNNFPKEKNLLRGHLALKKHLYPNLATIYGLDFIDGITGWGIKDAEMWTAIFVSSPPEKRRRMLERGGVTHWVSARKPDPGSTAGELAVVKMKENLPRALLAPRSRYGGDYRQTNLFYSERFDPGNEVLLSGPFDPKPASENEFRGKILSLKYSANRIDFKTEQNGFGHLALFDSYFPGWTAWIDGRRAPVLRGDYFYRALALSPGEHEIRMEYRPEGFSAGLFISLTSFMTLLTALFNRDLRRIWAKS